MRFYSFIVQAVSVAALAAIYPRNETAFDKSIKEASIPSEIGSVVCVTPGQSATATWVNALHQTCTWTGVVGSNFGPRGNGNEYVKVIHLNYANEANDCFKCSGIVAMDGDSRFSRLIQRDF